jgi:hypothetical protein
LTSTFNLTDRIRSATTVGGQYLNEQVRRTDASGAVLLPGTSSLNGASARFTVNEVNQKIVTVAGFAEQRFELSDRLFVTAALRFDDASVFGNSAAGWTYYPSLTSSYVISEEDWFPKWDFLNTLRLRAAYGRAGQRPGFRQSQTFFNPVSVNITDASANLPAVTIGGPVGNAFLSPEITAETEAGFNVNFLKNFSLEYSYSQKNTRDQILRVPLSSAAGFQDRWENAATLEGSTHEIAFGAVLASRKDFFWRMNITGDRTRSRITELRPQPYLTGPDGNTRIFRIAPDQQFGIIFGEDWIRTADQLATNISNVNAVGSNITNVNEAFGSFSFWAKSIKHGHGYINQLCGASDHEPISVF